eukprot:CAMPEP_0197031586 /NCGR_PEP_ID=MMETSP1384-20130603/10554_1 /TAXON_ID=29189 /ORGANISM="Ammonia sp." /LENGTH=567 /DNA_ID=CAMNT_0042461137 /DNA_START=109 /DNA_END=1812 /DNA_ORIENTATION=+
MSDNLPIANPKVLHAPSTDESIFAAPEEHQTRSLKIGAFIGNVVTTMNPVLNTGAASVGNTSPDTPSAPLRPLILQQSYTAQAQATDVGLNVIRESDSETKQNGAEADYGQLVAASPDSHASLNDLSPCASCSAEDGFPFLNLNDDASIPMGELLMQLTGVEEEVLFAQNGYAKIKKQRDILQGALIQAALTRNHPLRKMMENDDENDSSVNTKTESKDEEDEEQAADEDESAYHVTVKKCDKVLVAEQISYADDDDMHFCVDDNIVKERKILEYLTIDNYPLSENIVKFIDFFQSDDDYYLVMEDMANDVTLKQFVEIAHQHIKDGNLSKKEYQKIVKYIFWQICAVVHWLHNDMHCCVMALKMDTILLENADFVANPDGRMSINPCITAKLADFSKAEVFQMHDTRFRCMKYRHNITNEPQYLCPKLYSEQIYDARACDMWCLGMILFQMATGKPLYEELGINEADSPKYGSGYWAVMTAQMKVYLAANNLTKFVNAKMLSIMCALLVVDETQRMNANDVLKHAWFKAYYQRYQVRIQKKSTKQAEELAKQQAKLKQFPYYFCAY